MQIYKIGSYHGAPNRYLNYLKENPNINLKWIHLNNDKMINELKLIAKSRNVSNIYFHELPPLISKFLIFLQSIAIIKENRGIGGNGFFIFLFKMAIKLIPTKKIAQFFLESTESVYFSGTNDVDGSLILVSWLKMKFPKIKITHSYIEHRCKYRIDEYLALTLSDKLIIPSIASINWLSKIYNIDLADKALIGNEDWRSKSDKDFILNANIEKLSSKDNRPHVVILTRIAEFDNSGNVRRGSRINYVSIIETLAKENICIHLKAMSIRDTSEGKSYIKDSPYHNLAKLYPDNVYIESPLDMNINSGYLELAKFDFGIIHNYVEGELINDFSKINIPNRVFEYFTAQVEPIVIHNTLVEVESIILQEGYGIIADSYQEAARKMHERIKNTSSKNTEKFKVTRTFESFMKIVISA
jgi:hypothetical protein